MSFILRHDGGNPAAAGVVLIRPDTRRRASPDETAFATSSNALPWEPAGNYRCVVAGAGLKRLIVTLPAGADGRLCRDELTGAGVSVDGWDIRGRGFGVVVGARRGSVSCSAARRSPGRVIAAQMAPRARRGSR